VAHCYGNDLQNVEKAKKITHDLQIADMANTYICPLLAFSHLAYEEVGYDEEMELCIDLLSECQKIIVASNISKGVAKEIEFAELVGMEVEFFEKVE
jgi:hypothetical protein